MADNSIPLLEAIKAYGKGFVRGNTADTLGAPVDMINMAISPVTKAIGLYNDNPVGGSKFFRKLAGMPEEDANIAETAGGMFSISGATKAAVGASTGALALIHKMNMLGRDAKDTKDAGKSLQRGMIVAADKLDAAGKVDLNVAREMTAEGAKPSDVYYATGVFKDKNFEKAGLSDANAKIIPNSMGSFEQPSSLAGVLDHPELFNLYPELKKTGIYYDPKLSGTGTMGQFWPHSNEIGVRPDVKGEELRSVILHEVQHRIQNIEGWQGGGSIQSFLPFKPSVVQEKIDAARKSSDPAVQAAAERYKTVANMKIREAGNRYSNLAGEQEARYTQETMNMDENRLAKDLLDLIRSGKTPSNYDTRPIRPVFGGGDVYFKD